VARGATIATELLSPFLRMVRDAGRAAERRLLERSAGLLASAGVDQDSLGQPNARIPHSAAVGLMRLIADLLGDPAVGLHAGMTVGPDDFGLFEYVVRSAPTLELSARSTQRYLPLLHDGAESELIADGKQARLIYRLTRGLASPAGVHEFVMAAFITGTARYLGIEAPPAEVHFEHAAPAHAAELERVFGSRVRFAQEHTALVFPAAALALPMVHADAGLHATLCRYADQQLAQLTTHKPVAHRVRNLVRERIGDGEHERANLPSVASTLRTSARSLRRKLEHEGTSHSDLVDDVRRELAVDLLAQAELDLSQIAFRLGFAYSPAFHRAFRRWYGMGPSDYRKRMGGGGAWMQRLLANS
jgi:AraC-like DNA-binding protein